MGGQIACATGGGTGNPSPTGETGLQLAGAANAEAERREKERFVELAPKLTKSEHEEINKLFRAFIFRRRKTGEYWTTCCRRHIVLNEERTVTPEMEAIMEEEQSPEPRYHWGCAAGWMLRNPNSETRIKCPHCGAEATLKELGRTGERGNLTTYRRAVVLRWYRGALWAVGYNAMKSYMAPAGPLTQLNKLTALPEWKRTYVLRLRPGMAEATTRDWWYSGADWGSMSRQTEPRRRGIPFPVGDPFTYNRDYGKGYDVIGWEEIQKSPFQYIGIREIKKNTGTEALRLLVMACCYPRQMEMLHKAGLDLVIRNYADKGVKTAWLFDWSAQDPKRFLRVPKKVFHNALNDGTLLYIENRLEALEIWKRRKGRDSLENCFWLEDEIGDKKKIDRCLKNMKRYGVSLERLRNYLMKQQSQFKSVSDVEQIWADYLDAAEMLGLDLENDVIRFPKDLSNAHDERFRQCAHLIEKSGGKKISNEKVKTIATIVNRRNKYEFAYNGLVILVPRNSNEIVQEGKALKHCVGGYAARHEEGKLTILFLRREDTPEKSLVTIEVNGNKIEQAHGYKNEREACQENPQCIPPMKLYKEFFDVWRDWLKRGSPRDRDGKPKLKKTDKQCLSLQEERKVS